MTNLRRQVLGLALAAGAALLPVAGTAAAMSAGAGAVSPIGLWKTFDDKTGAARALVRLYEHDGRLFGRIERSFTPGAENRVCGLCTDERKNQPIIGLIIIRNMKTDGDVFDRRCPRDDLVEPLSSPCDRPDKSSTPLGADRFDRMR